MKWFASFLLGVCLLPAAMAQPRVPRPALEFRAADASGKALTLSSYRGKVVVIQFLYTTCTHCQATARVLSGIQNELGPAGLQVIGVAFNGDIQQSPGAIEEFSKSNHLSFPVGVASRDAVLAYLGIGVMERFVVPQMVIIDRRGSIRAQSKFMGSPELQEEPYLRSFVSGLLKETAPVRSARASARGRAAGQ